MRPIGVYNLPCTVTLIGMLCSLLSIQFTLTDNVSYAIIALIWAGIFDIFDGLIARAKIRSTIEQNFGMQIDSLVDVVSFGLAPCVLLFGYTGANIPTFLVSSIYLACCVQRLAHFNSCQAVAGQTIKYYTGLPVTYSALILPICLISTWWLNEELITIYCYFIYIIIGLLYILPLKIPKPKRLVYILMPTLAIIFSALWFARALYA